MMKLVCKYFPDLFSNYETISSCKASPFFIYCIPNNDVLSNPDRIFGMFHIIKFAQFQGHKARFNLSVDSFTI